MGADHPQQDNFESSSVHPRYVYVHIDFGKTLC